MTRQTIDALARVVIALILVLGFLVVLYLLLTRQVPEANTRLIDVMIGALGTVGLASIVGFFFGSSSGSKAKDDAASPPPAAPPPPSLPDSP